MEQQLRAAPERFQSSLLADILHQTVLHPLCVRYPPSAAYRRCFLTELIKKHESTAADPLDELYDALARILNEEESAHCYKSYLLVNTANAASLQIASNHLKRTPGPGGCRGVGPGDL